VAEQLFLSVRKVFIFEALAPEQPLPRVEALGYFAIRFRFAP
jgi:hypothetical protein